MIMVAFIATFVLPLVALRVDCAGPRFTVAVTVLPSAKADAELARIALPAGVHVETQSRGERGALLQQAPAVAAAHFQHTLPDAGWRLDRETRSECGSVEQVWAREDGRILIRMQAPLGGMEATRIRMQAVSG
ncbi:MAG TPA: hypothetical protein DDZ76_08520 [Xanthomonadales bacterium]|nr:hypothetical protein [Xanthomonadales bacterium]